MIQEYVEKKYGLKVHTAYIAEVKRSLGLTMYDAPNAVEELKQPRKHPPKEKVEAKILGLYKRVCRRYLYIYPSCVKSYIEAYQEMWEDEGEQLENDS